jgi:crotonobetainyl-CoA:carnitine CoA-transferase CaiB-like acyl-CoA transferase
MAKKAAKKAAAKKAASTKAIPRKETPKKPEPAKTPKASPAKPQAAKSPAPPPPPPPPPASKRASKKAGRSLEETPRPQPITPTDKKAGKRPLDGVTVLDLTTGLAGAAATLSMAQFGAEVVKVEAPDGGDPARASEPTVNGVGALFLQLNRGKKSVALNLDKPAGKDALAALAAKADVVVDDRRPGELDALGVGYAKLSGKNKRLIYTAISPYGREGPNTTKAGRDINVVAQAGVLDLVEGKSGPPELPGLQIGEIAGGAGTAVVGTLLALLARESTGVGQIVDAAMIDGVMGLLTGAMPSYAVTRRQPQPGKEPHFGKYACYNVYPVRNSRWVAVGALDPEHWAELCKALDRKDLIPDQFAEGDRQQVLIAELTRVFQRKEIREWAEVFLGKEVCVTEVRSLGEAVQDPHLIERGLVVPIRRPEGGSMLHLGVIPKLMGTPGHLGGEAPALGAHTREALESAGLGKRAIEDLIAKGVATQA